MKSISGLSLPAGRFREVDGEVLGTDDQAYFRSLSDDELLQALRQSMSKLQSGSFRVTQELRQHLLPALLVLRERHMQPGRRKPILGRPTYYEVLASLNLKPDTVRKWFKQTVSADRFCSYSMSDRNASGRPTRQFKNRLLRSCSELLTKSPPNCWTATSRQPHSSLASTAKHATRKAAINTTELNKPKPANVAPVWWIRAAIRRKDVGNRISKHFQLFLPRSPNKRLVAFKSEGGTPSSIP
jgi:hypothetical protein